MNTATREDLFFWYPEPGAGSKWRPSWDQVMTTPLSRDYIPHQIQAVSHVDEEINVNRCDRTFCIENGFVRGLAVGGTLGTDRHGELFVEDVWGVHHILPIVATHQYPIPEETYTLIRQKFDHYTWSEKWVQWVVGRRLSDERFEKLSVFKMAGDVALGTSNDLSGEYRDNILAQCC
ncbi:hypothetical protein ARMGADRAFT_157446 [Armillaria gallica]|uniref:Uncharacterized protein n=1 Tax=Armillaria gallica TaxID=47427 RepID=A0A2H3C8F1_ARMGA|nr:hypothetical protein ARMGADRAFT_157446 [Armillaria gallica]